MQPTEAMGTGEEEFFREWLKRMEGWRRVVRFFCRELRAGPSSGPSSHLLPGGQKRYAEPAAFGKEREACSSPRRGEVPERSEAMRGQRCRHPLHHVKRND